MANQQVAANLDGVRRRIASACAAAGRSPDSVELVAVSKRVPQALVIEACRAGQWHFGENRVHDALARQLATAEALAAVGLNPHRLCWHFIGHLQRNKVRQIAGGLGLFHGLDSWALAETLSRRCAAAGVVQSVLLQVNISAEPQKSGFQPDLVGEAAARIAELSGLKVQGMMGMARRDDTAAAVGQTFAALRRVCESARRQTGLDLPDLSMGMSADFELAIAEGATIVRVGSAIFGPRID